MPENLVRKRSAIDFRVSPALEVSCYQCNCCVIWVEKMTRLSWPDCNFTYKDFLTQRIVKKLVCKISKRPMTKVSFPMLSKSLETTFTTVSLNDVTGASELSSKKSATFKFAESRHKCYNHLFVSSPNLFNSRY